MPLTAIRKYHSSDLPTVYRICLETGADGEDATGTIESEILGHIFAGSYAVLEPELCFILTIDGAPVGYVLGTADSVGFSNRCEELWFPELRRRYPLRDKSDRTREALMVRAIHEGYKAPACASDYPAHLHIDLLPAGQGAGNGRRMIETFIQALRSRGVTGVHLGVSAKNKRAVAFYPKVGFKVIDDSRDGLVFGLKL